MAGIAGVIGVEPGEHRALVERMAASSLYSPKAGVESWSDSYAGLSRVRVGVDNVEPQPLFNRERSKCIVMFGECFGYEPKKAELERQGQCFKHFASDAEFCLRLYEAEGERAFAQLSGSYCFAIYDLRRRELVLVSDRLGTRPIFYATTPGGRLVFATQVASVLCCPEISRELDVGAALEFCALQRVLGSKTFHRSIAVLPPASLLRFRDGRIVTDSYWAIRYRPESGSVDDYATELATVLRRSVGHVFRGDARVAMLLSGGLDARMVVAAAEGELSCVTFADYMNAEVEAARDVAKAKSMDFDFLQRDPDHYVKLLDAAVQIGSGMYPFNHAHAIGFLDRLPEKCDVVTHGYVPELLFRGSSLPRVTHRIGRFEVGQQLDSTLGQSNLGERLFWRGYSLLGRGVVDLLTPKAKQVLSETLAADARQMVGEASEASADVYDQFLWPDVKYHARYPSMLFEASLRVFLTERSFVFHNEVIDIHLRLPRLLRSDNRLWLMAMAILDKRIARIRDANTGFAPRMPPVVVSALKAGRAAGGRQNRRVCCHRRERRRSRGRALTGL